MLSQLRKKYLPVIMVFSAVLAFAIMVKNKPEAERIDQLAYSPLVTVIIAKLGEDEIRIKGFGSMKAKSSVSIVPQVSGEVVNKSVIFEAGGFCPKGEILLCIDDTDYQMAFAKAKADVAQMELTLVQTTEEAQVAASNWEKIHRAENQIEASNLVLHKPQLKLALANLEAAKTALKQAKVNLQRCTLYAPFDGRVLTADVDVGQYLRSGIAIGTVYAIDVAEVIVQVPDEDLAWITTASLGKSDNTNTIVDVFADFAEKKYSWQGRAIRLGGAIDNRTRLVPVVVEVKNPNETGWEFPPIIEGLFVTVEFRSKPLAGSVVIPRTALRAGNKVWVITEDRRVDLRSVTVAWANIENAIISAGLQAGESVCTSNLPYITEGLRVRIKGEVEVASLQASAESSWPFLRNQRKEQRRAKGGS